MPNMKPRAWVSQEKRKISANQGDRKKMIWHVCLGSDLA